MDRTKEFYSISINNSLLKDKIGNEDNEIENNPSFFLIKANDIVSL